MNSQYKTTLSYRAILAFFGEDNVKYNETLDLWELKEDDSCSCNRKKETRHYGPLSVLFPGLF